MRYRRVLGSSTGAACCALALVLAAPACGAESHRVPDITGDRLDAAQERLDDIGLGYEVIGGGAFGVVVESHWQVCDQDPRPGRRGKSVELVVARSCPRRPARGRVPAVEGLRLDVAEHVLGARDLEYYVYSDGKVIIGTNWTVCDQYPEPGERASEIELDVERFSCAGEEEDD